jgi:hypothetical protein
MILHNQPQTMDPLTYANAFATLVSLMGMYKSEKALCEAQDAEDFKNWLSAHKHDELARLITETYHLNTEMDKLLRQDHEVILKEIRTGNQLMADFISRSEAFSEVAERLGNRRLSDQAIEFLKAFWDSEHTHCLIDKVVESIICFYSPDTDREDIYYSPKEPRFIADDVQCILEYGLIYHSSEDDKTKFYRLTRSAKQFVAGLD